VGDCLTTDRLIEDENWLRLARELMSEVIRAGNAFDLRIPMDVAEELIEKTRIMGAYRPSTLIDFLRGSPIELEALFFEPLRRARSRGVQTPRLEARCGTLQSLAEHGS
jgi:2-dehydropantoate 2-reductase